MIRIEGLITLSADKSGLAEHAQAILCFNSDNNPFLFVNQPAGNRRLEPGPPSLCQCYLKTLSLF
jgi:hypothetical protein